MPAKTIVVSANLAWNLTHFRAGLIRALISAGYRIFAAAPDDVIHRELLEQMGCEFASIPLDAKGLSPFADLVTFVAYVRLFRKVRPAAFLGWTIKPNIYGALAASACGVPAILNVSGLGTAFIRENTITRLVSVLYRSAFKNVDTVFFQNISDRNLFVDRSLVAASKSRLLPGSGIALSDFPAAPSDVRPKGRFVMIARLLADKGTREYVSAARLMRRDFPDTHFVLAGFVDVANRTAIKREEVDAWVAAGIVEYHPPVEDVRPLIAESDCVVLPSYREGTSRILLEASALGRPIIATDVPGCREVVEDGRTGLLCTVRDSTSLAQAMRRILQMPDSRWREMGRAGRVKVAKEFDEARIIEAYCEALRVSLPRRRRTDDVGCDRSV